MNDNITPQHSPPQSPREYNVVFQVLNDNVRRLQTQLKETQHSMQRICERANTLKVCSSI